MHTRFDEVFRISVILKGLDAALEIIGGTLLFFVTPHAIERLVHWLTARELAANPHDFIATLLVHSAHGLVAGSTTFAAVYLLVHGLLKILVVIGVLTNQYWAYPLLIVVLLAFIIYQIIQITDDHSISLTLLTTFDVFVLVMTWLEWQKQRTLRRDEAASDIKA